MQPWLPTGGIFHEITTAYSPESNGRAERLNRTLMDMARSSMVGAQCEAISSLWADAVSYANYIRNRLYTRSFTENKRPYAVIDGMKPNPSAVNVFGCEVFKNILKKMQGEKVSIRAEEDIFVGVDSGDAARIFFTDSRKVTILKDDFFDENQECNKISPDASEKLVCFEIPEMETELLGLVQPAEPNSADDPNSACMHIEFNDESHEDIQVPQTDLSQHGGDTIQNI